MANPADQSLSAAPERRTVINVAARIARTGRRVVLHLPRDWPWADSWHRLHEIATGPPAPALH